MMGESAGMNLRIQSVSKRYAARMAEAVQKEQEEGQKDSVGASVAASVETQDRLEISEEGRRSLEEEGEAPSGEAALSEAAEELAGSQKTEAGGAAESTKESEESADSEKKSGKVGFNAGKRARQLAAASSPEQVQMVLDLLNKDLDDCEAGQKQGMCDENEVEKVKAMIQRARQRMNEVSGQENEEENQGVDAFAMASLM